VGCFANDIFNKLSLNSLPEVKITFDEHAMNDCVGWKILQEEVKKDILSYLRSVVQIGFQKTMDSIGLIKDTEIEQFKFALSKKLIYLAMNSFNGKGVLCDLICKMCMPHLMKTIKEDNNILGEIIMRHNVERCPRNESFTRLLLEKQTNEILMMGLDNQKINQK
jgi:hypothetical protein